jgi:hypothetical protein
MLVPYILYNSGGRVNSPPILKLKSLLLLRLQLQNNHAEAEASSLYRKDMQRDMRETHVVLFGNQERNNVICDHLIILFKLSFVRVTHLYMYHAKKKLIRSGIFEFN